MTVLEKEEGLVLKSFDFRDRQKIITLFTLRRGLISLIVKGITRTRPHLLTLTSPFTQGDYHFTIGRSDLYLFHDGSSIETNHHLRQSLAHINLATTMASALLTSQMGGKPAPKLYALTLTYLKKLPEFKDPAPLSASFLLKLLKHDGHLSLQRKCSSCTKPPTHLHLGEPFCTAHLPGPAERFTPEEWQALQILTEARTLAALKEPDLSPHLQETIKKLFSNMFERK